MATKKPCPGCGKVERYRKTTEVCTQCNRDIADGRAFREYFDKKKHKAEIRSLPEEAHWFPYIQDGEEFRRVFYMLIGLISIPTRTRSSENLISGQDGGYDNTETSRIFPRGVPDKLADLYEAVKDIAHQNNIDGRKDMLRSLMSIRCNMEEFIKQMIEAEESNVPDDR